jgi:hypothetical protein
MIRTAQFNMAILVVVCTTTTVACMKQTAKKENVLALQVADMYLGRTLLLGRLKRWEIPILNSPNRQSPGNTTTSYLFLECKLLINGLI